LIRARVPCAPVLTPAEVVALPHLAEREFFPTVPHAGRGEVRIPRSPFQLDGQPVTPHAGAPYRVGEHTRRVLEEFLGYDRARVDGLLAQGAVAAP
jgi:crotonobetainyl-CoA:carnitine CoA-transferase CaiB-like acyl-CoA transferase